MALLPFCASTPAPLDCDGCLQLKNFPWRAIVPTRRRRLSLLVIIEETEEEEAVFISVVRAV